jgi:hypothetical protein
MILKVIATKFTKRALSKVEISKKGVIILKIKIINIIYNFNK